MNEFMNKMKSIILIILITCEYNNDRFPVLSEIESKPNNRMKVHPKQSGIP